MYLEALVRTFPFHQALLAFWKASLLTVCMHDNGKHTVTYNYNVCYFYSMCSGLMCGLGPENGAMDCCYTKP